MCTVPLHAARLGEEHFDLPSEFHPNCLFISFGQIPGNLTGSEFRRLRIGKKVSSIKKQIGKGTIEGVVVPKAANNASRSEAEALAAPSGLARNDAQSDAMLADFW